MLTIHPYEECYGTPVTAENIHKLNGLIVKNKTTDRRARIVGNYLYFLNKNKQVVDVVDFHAMHGNETEETTPWFSNLVTN